MMYDDIFFINSALIAPAHLSVFSEEERFEHTVQTLKSIKKYAPNSKTYIFDCSQEMPDWQAKKLEDVVFVHLGKHFDVRARSVLGQRSIAETSAFVRFLDWFVEDQKDVFAKRIVKLSGRYRLTENFPEYNSDMADSFVFVKPEDSWMPKEKQEKTGVTKLYKLRQWQMGFTALPLFMKKLPDILSDCVLKGIDVEHSYYKHLHTEKVIEVEKIGVEGYIAPSGEYINE